MPGQTFSPRSLVRFMIAALAAVLLSIGGLLVASPASAHDELVSSDPAAGSTLDALPAQLALTFSADISTEQGANEVQVTDAAGTNLVSGAPTVQDNVLTQPLAGAASGAVTVLWKVVSSDGHPISGELEFTVTPASTPTPTPTPTATPTPTPAPVETSTPTPAPTVAPDDGGDAAALPWIIGGVIVAAVGGAVIYLLVSRARREREKAQLQADAARAAGSEPPADR